VQSILEVELSSRFVSTSQRKDVVLKRVSCISAGVVCFVENEG
jgi:hypothetical protein